MRRCLEKDPKRRLHDIADASIEIEDALSTPKAPAVATSSAADVSPQRVWLVVGAATVAVLAVAATMWVARSRPSLSTPETRLDITTPPTSQPTSFAISPDGLSIVFAATSESRSSLWLRVLSGDEARPLAGTDGAQYPFWSPDNRSIGFFADGKLKRIDLDRGVALSLADAPDPRGGTWTRDDLIFFTPIQISPVLRVAATGGPSSPITHVEPQQLGHLYPEVLPDSLHLLYRASGAESARGIYISRLDGSDARRILDATYATYGPSGHLLYVRTGMLFAQPFDLARLALMGNPFRVAANLSGLIDLVERSDDRLNPIYPAQEQARHRRSRPTADTLR